MDKSKDKAKVGEIIKRNYNNRYIDYYLQKYTNKLVARKFYQKKLN